MKLKHIVLATLLGSASLMAQASELPNGPHVVTSGTASIEVAPDMATITIEVSVSNKDAASAKKQVDDRVSQYFDFLQKNGVDKKDINAANLRTQPEYDYLKNNESVLKGYRAVRTVQVKLRQLDKLNDLLDGALKSGLNEIRSVELGLAQPEVYRTEVRQKAMQNASDQAAELAKGFSVKLGPVYSIRYRANNYQPAPVTRMYMSADVAAKSSAAETYEQQTVHFDDQVDVVFELQR